MFEKNLNVLQRNKNLLPTKVFVRDALYQILSKISPKFAVRFSRLTIFALLILFFSGYQPALTFPPVRLISTLASEKQEQKAEVIPSSFPEPIILPHPGYMSTRFTNYHPGVDIASGLGMPIHPINPGVVEISGRDFFGLGNYVMVAHANGLKSTYAHMGKVYTKVGQSVTKENTLGEVGLTGNTSGPHTHLEISLNGKNIDPETILPQMSPIPQQFNVISKK